MENISCMFGFFLKTWRNFNHCKLLLSEKTVNEKTLYHIVVLY